MSDDSARRGPLSTPATTGGQTEDAGPPGAAETVSPTVPRYRILGPLGIGGMGVVYRAEDTRLGRTVALKFLPPMLTPNSRAKVRFLNEARAASALDHPNICTIYEIGETDEGQLYLAMACYEGETLKRRLERGPLPVAEALHIALQVARGLAKAHRHGIVHRDIKPANLMLTAEGIVKVLDFGIARLPEESQAGPLLGTPGYMSPEQARVGAVDARSDIWSLGVVLHEMLTGSLPVRGGQSPPEAPTELDRVLSRMLAEEPADRPPDAGALLTDLADLERAAAGKEETPAPGLSRRRFSAWAVAGAATTLLVGAWLWSGRRLGGAGPVPSQGAQTRLTDALGKEWFPSLSPHADFFVYAKKFGDRNRLFWQQVGGRNALELNPDPVHDDSQPALSPDGKQIVFRSEREGGGLFLMGATGESVRRVTDVGFNPAWSPDGREIVFATDRILNPRIRRNSPSEIYRVDLQTLRSRRVDTGGIGGIGDAVQPSWSPHGLRIAYWGLTPPAKRVIWTVPVEGGPPVRATEGKSVDWNPVWSPDGRYLYFASDRSGVTNLWRLPIDESSGKAGTPEPVTTSTQENLLLSLSRDGKQIAYASDATRTTLERVAFDLASGRASGSAMEITQTPAQIMACDTSRDGRWIVYQTSMPHEDLFLIHPDGTGQLQLTADEFNNRQPRWSPDGTRIAFYSDRGGSYEIWLVHADGSQLERAAATPGRMAYHPIWSPDNQQLACDLEENEALIDLTQPFAERRPVLLPSPGRGLGFSASSWSGDSRWLAGAFHLQKPDKLQVPGVVLYSRSERTYVRLTDRGEGATWLSDSRHLLYWDKGTLLLFDLVSRTSRQVLTTPPGSDYNDLCLSPDDRFLYLARNAEEGDIWLLTMK